MSSCKKEHEILLLMFAYDGLPSVYICKNAKELMKGTFYQKLKDPACHLKQLEPFNP